MNPVEPRPNTWNQTLHSARCGSVEDLGRLLDSCRAYLLLVANAELDSRLQPKAGASDLVQETFVEAQRDFAQFHGATEEELRGWLRQVLRHNIANFTRSFRDTEMRRVSREVSLDDSAELARELCSESPSPCTRAVRNEQAGLLELALLHLPDEYRTVVTLRNRERITFEEIGRRMGRSAEAVRKLWVRAIERLRDELANR